MMRRSRDAEADLNLPPGFRFHPTDDELVVHYLCRKATQQLLPVPIIADVDLYKFDPWQLPEMALFGQKEWYFFTPRDRKYPNGSRPNRAAGTGYWKATGADKPVTPEGSGKPLGIKKALVFYAGKAPRGVKTNWIMHEYRLADSKKSATHHKKGSLRLDDWVLCRLYNKKNNWEKERQHYQIQNQNQTQQQQRTHKSDQTDDVDEAASDSHRTAESDIDNDDFMTVGGGGAGGLQMGWDRIVKEDSEWFTELNLDDLQNTFATFGGGAGGNPSATGMTSDEVTLMCQDYSSGFSNHVNFSGLVSPKTFNQSKQWWM